MMDYHSKLLMEGVKTLHNTFDVEIMTFQKKHTENELKVFEAVAKRFKREIYPAINPYSRFDGEDDEYIYEIKYRDKYYDPTMIEFDKYSFNLLYAKNTNRDFIYCVGLQLENCFIVHIFNLTTLTRRNYDFGWEWRKLPQTSHFDNNKKIDKFVGYMKIKEAIKSITVKE